MTASSISDFVQRTAAALGFELCGVAPAEGLRVLDAFPAWIASGFHGEMQYLAARNEAGELKRAALENVAPWARSVIVCAVNYNTAQPYSTEFVAGDRTTPLKPKEGFHPGDNVERGWISRYAWGQKDYHDVLLPKLRALEAELVRFVTNRGEAAPRTWCYVDTGPVVERAFAQAAGVGWVGKNTCIINEELGSWLFLGVILTSLEMESGVPAADRCGSCTRCLDACPTRAFTGPYALDASRCISYLTIEKRGAIPEELREGMGRNIYGCDICQDVCPWNRRAPATAVPEFEARTELVNPRLRWISGMNSEEFRATFRGSPIKRTRITGLRRNAVIAMGNSGDQRFVPELERLAHDEDEVVAEHARWALRRVTGRG
jgi:epoxyqueuosine reductase